MYKLWAKKIRDNKIVASVDIKNNDNISLSEKRQKCLVEMCGKFDLSMPIWLEKHNSEFNEFKRVVFYQDDFVDDINFDKLEIELIDDGTKHKK